MIDRFSLVSSKDKIYKALGKHEFTSDYYLSYNISPLDYSYIITQEERDLIQKYRWGLLPATSRQGNNSGNLYNARSQGIVSKPSYRIPIRQKRCLVLADGFYVLDKEGQAYRAYNKNKGVILFAGLYDQCYTGGNEQKTFTIITSNSNREVSRYHNTSPVILDGEAIDVWLNPYSSIQDVLSLLKTNENYTLSLYKVSSDLKKKDFNNPTLHEEIVSDITLFDLQ